MAFVDAGTLTTGSSTVQPAAPASMVPGNLLVCLLGGNQASALGTYTQSGGSTTWNQGAAGVSATPFARSEIWWTIIASSSDTMPTWANNSTLFAGIIAQVSATVAIDRSGSNAGTTSPVTVSASAADRFGTQNIIFFCRMVRAASAAVNTTSTDNVNGLGVGTGINVLANQTASAVGHFRAGYVTTATTGGSADTDVATWTMTTTAAALCIASFGVAPLPALMGERSFQAVKRAAVFCRGAGERLWLPNRRIFVPA